MTFLENKYSRWYDFIINRAKERILDSAVYTEKHHIIPRSLGGSNDQYNLVRLTAREHFICHLLLPKMLIGQSKNKMLHALWNMVNQQTQTQIRYKVNSHLYEIIKSNNAKALSEENKGKPSKNKGRIITKEWREKLSKANTGKKRGPESIAKQVSTMTGRKRPPRSEEWTKKLIDSRNKNGKWEQTKKELSLSQQGRTFLYNDDLKKCVHVKEEQVPSLLLEGWIIGRKRYSSLK